MAERGELSLPDDFKVIDNDTPKEAVLWFLKSGVPLDIAKAYRFGYSEALARVVMPVWDNQESLIAVQSRAVYDNQQPKYLNKTGGDKNPIFESDDSYLLGDPIAEGLVMTEDILSTVRVGRLLPSFSTLGTSLCSKVAVRASTGLETPIYIWYDGDEAGVKGARKAAKTLELIGQDYRIVKTEKDPKEYNNEEIESIIRRTI